MGIRNRMVGQVRTSRAGRSGRLWAAILLIAVSGSWPVAAGEVETVSLMVGRSIVVDTGSPIQRVSLTSDDIADALVTSSAQLLVHGKTPGTISMFVWDRAGAIRRYDVTVARDLSRLTTQVHDLFPGERISVEGNGRSIVMAGFVSSKFIAEKAVEVAAGYVAKKEDVVNLLQVQEGATDQVLLQVRFAEVNRSAITELGSTFFTGIGGYKDVVARTTTGQNPGPEFDKEGLVFSDFLNLFLFDVKHQLGTIIKALQTKGQFQSLAEPNLVAESGKEASFLAGGEFPVPIAQGSASNASISVQYKEFGVRLNFTPIVRGTRVHLKVRPEVSTLDFANGVLLQGFRIPALSTRRTETELELEDGQTFAIAGLLNNQMNTTLRKIPGIGDIPILGLLFQSKAAQKEQTELVVMITPHILPRNSSGVTGALPRMPEPFLPPLKKTVDAPPPAFPAGPGRRGADGGAVVTPTPATQAVTTPVTTEPTRPTPAVAAGAVSALTPQGPILVQAPARVAPAIAKPSKPAVQAKTADSKALERARRDEAHASEGQTKRAAEEQAKSDRAAAKQTAKQAVSQRQNDERDKKQQDLAGREKAKRDAEAAVKAAQNAARQAETDKKQQKAIDAAAARLSVADAAYQAEIAKKSQP
jgi:pilus assembly protein CpaC